MHSNIASILVYVQFFVFFGLLCEIVSFFAASPLCYLICCIGIMFDFLPEISFLSVTYKHVNTFAYC